MLAYVSMSQACVGGTYTYLDKQTNERLKLMKGVKGVRKRMRRGSGRKKKSLSENITYTHAFYT
jgi:hypothetical protein